MRFATLGARFQSRWIQKLRRNRDGNVALEFAFVAPILIMMTAGVVDLGRAIWISSTLEAVATDTARYAMLHGAGSDEPASEDDVKAFASGRTIGVEPNALTVTVAWSPNNNPGSSVKIVLSHEYDFMLVGFLPLDPIILKGVASRVVI